MAMRSFFSLPVLLFLTTVTVTAQSIITFEKNAFLSGDVHQYLRIENINEIDEGAAGTSISWDYSNIISGDTVSSYMLDATTQEGHANFPESNIAILEGDELTF